MAGEMAVEMAGEPEIAVNAENTKQNKLNKMPWIETLRRAAIYCSPKLGAVYSNFIGD
ncbi:MAG TPA: hypothetical protein VK653_14325 [Xanthobacteraceae bacterium]|nr:hypothetical protein [Xanthobacteraceae bacterium]